MFGITDNYSYGAQYLECIDQLFILRGRGVLSEQQKKDSKHFGSFFCTTGGLNHAEIRTHENTTDVREKSLN